MLPVLPILERSQLTTPVRCFSTLILPTPLLEFSIRILPTLVRYLSISSHFPDTESTKNSTTLPEADTAMKPGLPRLPGNEISVIHYPNNIHYHNKKRIPITSTIPIRREVSRPYIPDPVFVLSLILI